LTLAYDIYQNEEDIGAKVGDEVFIVETRNIYCLHTNFISPRKIKIIDYDNEYEYIWWYDREFFPTPIYSGYSVFYNSKFVGLDNHNHVSILTYESN
jgi:hypothetical protein